MLRRRSLRCRDRRHRLHALAPTRGHQSGAVVAQRPSPIRVADHLHKTLDIPSKSRFDALSFAETHPNPLYLNGNRLHYLILKPPHLRLSDSPSDSVVLDRVPTARPATWQWRRHVQLAGLCDVLFALRTGEEAV